MDIAQFDKILDFGCGCGRIMRHWEPYSWGSKFFGCDYNPDLINWSKNNLPFAEFFVNNADPPLPVESESFDFIYVVSVFTHLSLDAQHAWMHELTRVLKPGGYLLFSVHGTTRTSQIPWYLRPWYWYRGVVVVKENQSGTNNCGTFHSEWFIREKLCKHLQFVDFVPGGAKDANQDYFLFRKFTSIPAQQPSLEESNSRCTTHP